VKVKKLVNINIPKNMNESISTPTTLIEELKKFGFDSDKLSQKTLIKLCSLLYLPKSSEDEILKCFKTWNQSQKKQMVSKLNESCFSKIKKRLIKTFSNENIAITLIGLGFIVFIIFGIIMFRYFGLVWFGKKISLEATSTVGTFIGGVVAPIWTLASIVLLYSTLKLQNKTFKLQRKELALQREELVNTREVFLLQKFENTFFNMLALHNELKSKIKITEKGFPEIDEEGEVYLGLNVFSFAKQEIKKYLDALISAKKNINNIGTIRNILLDNDTNYQYKSFLGKSYNLTRNNIDNNIQELLNDFDERDNIHFTHWIFSEYYGKYLWHYFRNLYHILKFIKRNEDDQLKQSGSKDSEVKAKYRYYVDLIQSQLNSDELFVLFFNGIYYPKMFDLLEKYQFLENLDLEFADLQKEYFNLYPETFKNEIERFKE
jgi:hypothetical protein